MILMIYDVYEQNEQIQEIIGMRKVVRYHTTNKVKAFKFMDAKNTLAGKNIWHVAEQVNNKVYFDIDEENIVNVLKVYYYYLRLFGKLQVIKTYHGYHIITQTYTDNLQWQYDICRVLNPLLEFNNIVPYITAVQKFYNVEREKQRINGLDKIEFTEYLPKKLKESGLYFGVGDFDLLFALNVIMKGYYCIRISKKAKDDKPYMVII